MGMNEIRDAKGRHKHDWGSCSKSRTLFDWQPSRCRLLPFEAEEVCKSRVLGRQVLFVGDSTTAQFFTSFVMLLGGRFGRNRVRGSTMIMLTASACDDEVRLSFVRSDLLLWTSEFSEAQAVARCDPIIFNYRWAQQAMLDADVFVMAVGQHFTSKLAHAPSAMTHKVYSFFTGNLNRTLVALRHLRAVHGRPDPSSVVIVGASLPMPRCERLAQPMTLVEALAHESENARYHAYGPSYWHSLRLNQLAKWLARDAGASFLDIASSLTRGDDALVRAATSRQISTLATRRRTACIIAYRVLSIPSRCCFQFAPEAQQSQQQQWQWRRWIGSTAAASSSKGALFCSERRLAARARRVAAARVVQSHVPQSLYLDRALLLILVVAVAHAQGQLHAPRGEAQVARVRRVDPLQ